MNRDSNSTAAWSSKKSRLHRAHFLATKFDRALRPKIGTCLNSSENSSLSQKFISDAISARPSPVAPASCRRFSAQPPRSTFARKLPLTRRAATTILIGTPKRLKFAVIPTKQTSRVDSNRYKKGGYQNALRARSCGAGSACPEPRRASSRRISAPITRRKIAGRMPVLRRAGCNFLTGTPKQLEITVTRRKQTPRGSSNRDTNSGSGVARLDRFSVANRLPTGHSLTRLNANASFRHPPIARKTNP